MLGYHLSGDPKTGNKYSKFSVSVVKHGGIVSHRKRADKHLLVKSITYMYAKVPLARSMFLPVTGGGPTTNSWLSSPILTFSGLHLHLEEGGVESTEDTPVSSISRKSS